MFFIAITVFLEISCNIISLIELLIVLPKINSLPSNNCFPLIILSVLGLAIGFVINMSIAPAILGSWPYGQQMHLIYVISSTSSSFTVVILVISALDRYIAFKKPLHCHLIVTKTRLIMLCFLIVFIILVPMLFWFLNISLHLMYLFCK